MSVFNRIKKLAESKRAPYSYEDLMRIREEESMKASQGIAANIKRCKAEETAGRSGILPLHQRCTFDNFEAETPAKQSVREFARQYAEGFSENCGSGFIFSGTTGTGKNHLAAAICNYLMPQGHSCLIITINELMIQLRKSYDGMGEDQFIQNMIGFDLLVLDEIGLQRKNDNEKLTINTIIDQRIGRMKPTGMLTNLKAKSEDPSVETMKTILGARILSRMRMNGGKWKSFNWEDYRK